MKTVMIFIVLSIALTLSVQGQVDSIVLPEPQTLDLQFLITEALLHNQEIEAATYQMDVMEAKVPQARALDDPELEFMQEEMPGFNWSQAMYSRLKLTQMFRFPAKLSTQGTIASIQAEHAHHDHLEKINEVVFKLKSAYYELWNIQQSIALEQENIRLMQQFSKIALTRYGVGKASQQEVLKAQVETAMLQNELISLRQRELGTKAMLMSILNRPKKDTLGYAFIPEEIVFTSSLDSIEQIALATRPMLIHDSLGIEESKSMLTLSKQEYLPDFSLGFERVTSPASGFNGWSVSAGITLPFAPWTIRKASARTEEATANVNRSIANYTASRNMILSNVRDLYYNIKGLQQQLELFRTTIMPQSQQALQAGLSAYQNGATDFLMLIDTYRTNVSLTKEYFMTRMKFEQAVSALEREAGYQNIATLN